MRRIMSLRWFVKSFNWSSSATLCWRFLTSLFRKCSSSDCRSRMRRFVASWSSSSRFKSSALRSKFWFTLSVSRWIWDDRSSSYRNFSSRAFFSVSNLSSSSRSLMFKSLSYLRSSCRLRFTTFLRLETSSSLRLSSSARCSCSLKR